VLLRLGLLGALGYAGYRMLGQRRSSAATRAPVALNPVAGGPLSNRATLQHTPDAPESMQPS
jgi:hypothetical protein